LGGRRKKGKVREEGSERGGNETRGRKGEGEGGGT